MSNKPIHTIKFGRVRAAIWSNSNESGTWYSVTVGRTFKKDDGSYEDTASFSVSDLPNVEKVADEAYRYVNSLGGVMSDDKAITGGDNPVAA